MIIMKANIALKALSRILFGRDNINIKNDDNKKDETVHFTFVYLQARGFHRLPNMHTLPPNSLVFIGIVGLLIVKV